MLTIGQLASYVGVTVRTVRHYHQLGLLPEPERDHSGYRRYAAEDVIRLRRICALAQAGVPLAQVSTLLEAEPAEFSAAVTEIDAELEARIAELQQRRKDLAQLPSAERLCISDEVADILDRERALGISERTVRVERDSWILLSAAYPDQLAQSLELRHRCLDDEDYRRMLLAMDAATDWDPDDPRLLDIAELSMQVLERLYPADVARQEAAEWTGTDQVTVDLLNQMNEVTPAWQRLYELVSVMTRERGYPNF